MSNVFTEKDMKLINYFRGVDNGDGSYHIEGTQDLSIDVFPSDEHGRYHAQCSDCLLVIETDSVSGDTLSEALIKAFNEYKERAREIKNTLDDIDTMEAELEDEDWEIDWEKQQ